MPKKPADRRTWPEDFKREIVRRWEKGESPTALAAEIGVKHVESLYAWKKRYGTGGAGKKRDRLKTASTPRVDLVSAPMPDGSLEEMLAVIRADRAELEALRAFKVAVIRLCAE